MSDSLLSIRFSTIAMFTVRLALRVNSHHQVCCVFTRLHSTHTRVPLIQQHCFGIVNVGESWMCVKQRNHTMAFSSGSKVCAQLTFCTLLGCVTWPPGHSQPTVWNYLCCYLDVHIWASDSACSLLQMHLQGLFKN